MTNEKARSSDTQPQEQLIHRATTGKLYTSNLVFCVMSCIDTFHSSERLERSQVFFLLTYI